MRLSHNLGIHLLSIHQTSYLCFALLYCLLFALSSKILPPLNKQILRLLHHRLFIVLG